MKKIVSFLASVTLGTHVLAASNQCDLSAAKEAVTMATACFNMSSEEALSVLDQTSLQVLKTKVNYSFSVGGDSAIYVSLKKNCKTISVSCDKGE